MISAPLALEVSDFVVCRDLEDFTARAAFRIASALDDAVAERGRAAIALSGGSTPEPVYDRLGRCLIPWRRVATTLVDERWAPETAPESNADMVGRSLLVGPASASRFLSFRRAGSTPEAAAARLDQLFRSSPDPLDVVVLGMGADGHTASLFPRAPELEVGLDRQSNVRCVVVRPGAQAPSQIRVSLTLRAILDARLLILLIRGQEKWDTFRSAMAGGSIYEAPIRAVLHQRTTPLETYWAP